MPNTPIDWIDASVLVLEEGIKVGQDCSASINRAIKRAVDRGVGIVYFPKGIYLIEHPIRISDDGVVLQGCGQSTVILIERCFLDDEGGQLDTPAINFQRIQSPDPVTYEGIGELKNVGIRDMKIHYRTTGPTSASGVNFAGCVGWFCERVAVFGDGRGMGASRTNGISACNGSRDGVISSCLVDGLSKPGFYLPNTQDVVVTNCVARNMNCTYVGDDASENWVAPGFRVAQSRRISIEGCRAHDNQGSGLQIVHSESPKGPIDGGVTYNEEDDEYSFNVIFERGNAAVPNNMYMEDLGLQDASTGRIHRLEVREFNYVRENLPATRTYNVHVRCPSGVLGPTTGAMIYAAFTPNDGIIVQGCSFTNCEHGIEIASGETGMVNRSVVINSVQCTDNLNNGILVDAAETVVIHGCICSRNGCPPCVEPIYGSGIVIRDVQPDGGARGWTSGVSVTQSQIVDNTSAGVYVQSAVDVTIDGVRIQRTNTDNHVNGAIALRNLTWIDSEGNVNLVPIRNLVLRDLDVADHNPGFVIRVHLNRDVRSYGAIVADGNGTILDGGFFSLQLPAPLPGWNAPPPFIDPDPYELDRYVPIGLVFRVPTGSVYINTYGGLVFLKSDEDSTWLQVTTSDE
jgi:hypothetical protein